MTAFVREGTFWCNEKPVSLALLSIAKRKGYHPILGVNGFLTYSRRELKKVGVSLPYNLIQGKGDIDIAFFNGETLVLGATATTTYAFIEYMKFPVKTFDLYTKTIFGNPLEVVEAYNELKKIGLKIPAPIVGKLYKSMLMVKVNARLRRLLSEKRRIIVFSLIPFYAPKNIVEKMPRYLNGLIEYLALNHDIPVSDYNVLLMIPQAIGDKPPKNLYFECVHNKKECQLGKRIALEDFPDVIGELRGCKGCRYIDICSRFFVELSNIHYKDR